MPETCFGATGSPTARASRARGARASQDIIISEIIEFDRQLYRNPASTSPLVEKPQTLLPLELQSPEQVDDDRPERAPVERPHELVHDQDPIGRPRIPYNDGVEEVLHFGWILSKPRRLREPWISSPQLLVDLSPEGRREEDRGPVFRLLGPDDPVALERLQGGLEDIQAIRRESPQQVALEQVGSPEVPTAVELQKEGRLFGIEGAHGQRYEAYL